MTCQQRRDSILLHALNPSDADALDASERESIRAHLGSGCPTCTASLAEAEATLAQIPLSLQTQSPSPHVRDRLMQRVLAAKSTDKSRATVLESGHPWRTLIALAACLALGFGATYYFVRPTYERKLASMKAQADVLRAQNLQLVALNKMPPQPNASGRVMWDHDRNMWHVTVFNMTPPPPGRTYELWFIKPDQTKIAATTFNVDANGNASMMVNVPKDIGVIAVAAITDEPMGGVSQPTGQAQLVGQVQ